MSIKKFFIAIFFLLPQYCHSVELMIGTSPWNPPFCDYAGPKDSFFGFDIDVMMEICHRIKAQCHFKPIAYKDLFPGILAGDIDLAISAIIITHDKLDTFLFSLPYLPSSAGFLTLLNSPINNPKDISGKVLGVRKGTPFKNLALSLYRDLTVKEYDNVSDSLQALADKNVDIVMLNNAAAKYWVTNNGTIYKLIGTGLTVGDGYGIMANKNKQNLISQINQAILAMESDNTYLNIYKRYFN